MQRFRKQPNGVLFETTKCSLANTLERLLTVTEEVFKATRFSKPKKHQLFEECSDENYMRYRISDGAMQILVKDFVTSMKLADIEFVGFGEHTVTTPVLLDFGFELYDVQKKAIDLLLNSCIGQIPLRTGLLAFDTNAGKTEVMGTIAATLITNKDYFTEKLGKVVIVSYDVSGAIQTFERLSDYGLDVILLSEVMPNKSRKLRMLGQDGVEYFINHDEEIEERVIVISPSSIKPLVDRGDWELALFNETTTFLFDEADKFTPLLAKTFAELRKRIPTVSRINGFTGSAQYKAKWRQPVIHSVVGMPFKYNVTYKVLNSIGQSASMKVKLITPTISKHTLDNAKLINDYFDLVYDMTNSEYTKDERFEFRAKAKKYFADYKQRLTDLGIGEPHRVYSPRRDAVRLHTKLLMQDEAYIESVLKDGIEHYLKVREEGYEGLLICTANVIEYIDTFAAVARRMLPDAIKVEALHTENGKAPLYELKMQFQKHEFDVAVAATIEHGLNRKDIGTIIYLAEGNGTSRLRQVTGRGERKKTVGSSEEVCTIFDISMRDHYDHFPAKFHQYLKRRKLFYDLGYDILK